MVRSAKKNARSAMRPRNGLLNTHEAFQLRLRATTATTDTGETSLTYRQEVKTLGKLGLMQVSMVRGNMTGKERWSQGRSGVCNLRKSSGC